MEIKLVESVNVSLIEILHFDYLFDLFFLSAIVNFQSVIL